jgi:hypothetical protein
MKQFRSVCLAIFLLASPVCVEAQKFFIAKDLSTNWQVHQGERYVPFKNAHDKTSTIYFWLEPAKFAKATLRLDSNEPYTVFINGQLIADAEATLDLPLDSIRGMFTMPVLLFAIHQEKIRTGGLQTLVLSPKAPVQSLSESPMHFSFFRDFAVVGMLILVSVLILVVQLNPKLASDYFSVVKMFFSREGEDSQIYSRITSSINILFCVYSSLMIAYSLMIIFRFVPSQYVVALAFQSNTFGESMVLWMKLSGIVLAGIFLKVLLVFFLSGMFGLREVGGIHIFNWVRLLLILFGSLTTVLFVYFISHGQSENFHVTSLQIISWLLIGWMLLIVLKLSKRMSHSLFHLFSYICATELIPLLITIKVLYN